MGSVKKIASLLERLSPDELAEFMISLSTKMDLRQTRKVYALAARRAAFLENQVAYLEDEVTHLEERTVIAEAIYPELTIIWRDHESNDLRNNN